MEYKGIILAGGHDTRLSPLTKSVSKQLLPIHDKPMVYYPLSLLMRNGINNVLIITNTENVKHYRALLGDGSDLGMNISYQGQEEPKGIPEAFILGEKFIGDSAVNLILGDNLFFGNLETTVRSNKAVIFVYRVMNPSAYGVYDPVREQIVEKPKEHLSPWAVTGFYFYPRGVVEIAKNLKPSARGELEITDINKAYLERGRLDVQYIPEGVVWLDAGSHDALADATALVRTIEARQGFKIACIEEISWKNKWIDDKKLLQLSLKYKNAYGDYLKGLLEGL